jgi:hypothetical protein
VITNVPEERAAEDGGGTFFRSVDKVLSDYTTSHPRRQ